MKLVHLQSDSEMVRRGWELTKAVSRPEALASQGSLYLALKDGYLRVYHAPVDKAAADKWCAEHNAIVDSPLMRALK